MAIELIDACVTVRWDEGKEAHVHRQEVRLFDTIEEAVQILNCPFLRAAVDGDEGGMISIVRTEDSKFVCVYSFEGQHTPCEFDTLAGAVQWLQQNHLRLRPTVPAGVSVN